MMTEPLLIDILIHWTWWSPCPDLFQGQPQLWIPCFKVGVAFELLGSLGFRILGMVQSPGGSTSICEQFFSVSSSYSPTG